MQPSSVKKHTMDVDGHKTSVSLEDASWSSLKEIAAPREHGTSGNKH